MAKGNKGGGLNLGGLLGGGAGGSKKRGAVKWNDLTGQSQRDFWARVNDIFMRILGRQATMSEAEKAYKTGLGDYALEQRLYMSKEFTHSKLFKQMSLDYNNILQQYIGPGYHLSAKQVQSFAANGYNESEIQQWVNRQPALYQRTTAYQDTFAKMADIYQKVMGVNPFIQQGVTQVHVDTNKKMPGIQGNVYNTHIANDANSFLEHLKAAALHFGANPQDYENYLMGTAAYRARAAAVTAAKPEDAGLTIDANGRPMQNGISPIGGGQRQADVAAV